LSAVPSENVHAVIPLCLLEAMRNLDTPIDDGLAELAQEMVSKRLGLSTTVAAQIERYREAAERDDSIALDEAVSVFRLVSRRSDAQLVFADAGRRAARLVARSAGGGTAIRISPRPLRRRLGIRAARRIARRVFWADLTPVGQLAEVRLDDSLAARAGAEGDGCYFYGAVFAELLRLLAGIEGAMLHDHCKARGDSNCYWRAAAVEGYDE
jgi:hypothetical protein